MNFNYFPSPLGRRVAYTSGTRPRRAEQAPGPKDREAADEGKSYLKCIAFKTPQHNGDQTLI
jgi:hypothetical protein